MAFVEIMNITKYYGRNPAVNGLSFSIEEGEIFGLLGPNGAGKTTTILMLATVIKPTSGTAKIGGYDVVKEPDKVRSLLGIAFQEPKSTWVDKPIEIVEWHGRICGLRGQELKERVKEVMERLEIWDQRNKFFYQLSGGNRKRVEVAKVFVQKPKFAIFDEPTAQVDVLGKHAIWDMIKELRDSGSTVMLATNDTNEADIISDRIGIMHEGKLVSLGTPSELKDSIPGGDILEIQLNITPHDEMVRQLSDIEGVSRVVLSEQNMLRMYLNRGEELVPAVLERISRFGAKIRYIKMKEPSLDDVFLYFTGERG
ncbi:ATP-binding cassette domain-containing protein [Candidatus Methanodesulfokora washburnensis]|jgi:ABC-2 type transport system ATP-binding protein|uniref:ATP-binding cassette domain-containing protein n=1 Tax=Candidatus Methanodesulfokora washburnensis TaxID=2478471 RepID=A0A3R9QAX4_9CREN|nr:ATP-binding cassette domain-containing protein [Candidatus Methanodesulfokores washburnensis]RSN71736.1 ATP-binding cassette domain-containing protein [Candidatus Methanodesulfokores washburnensis]